MSLLVNLGYVYSIAKKHKYATSVKSSALTNSH